MVLDRRAAERRRFARLLGLTDDGRGLPVGLSTGGVDGDDADGSGPTHPHAVVEDGSD